MTASDTAPSGAAPRDPALRTEALEQLLTERGLIDPAVMDKFIANYETNVGPLNGAKVVAHAWVDPEYKARLLADGTAAIKEVAWGGGANGEHIVVVENTEAVHNVVVCTLCSCYPWPVLGLPPSWYKDPAYRARVVREPRTVLREMGLELPAETEIVVHDSSSEVRWLVLPQRPARHGAAVRGGAGRADHAGRAGRGGRGEGGGMTADVLPPAEAAS